MNITTIIGPMLFGLVEKIISNQLTKHDINTKAEEIINRVQYEHNLNDSQLKERNQYILQLEAKLSELTEKLDSFLNTEVDKQVKNIQDKTPFFVDGLVAQAGEEIKKGIDAFTDEVVRQVVEVIEDKAEDFGLIEDNDSNEPVKVSESVQETEVEEEEVIPKTETEVEPESDDSFLTEKGKKILADLKNKHDVE